MITDQMTKSGFVVDVLNRDFQNIFKAQKLIVEQNTRLQGKDLKKVQGRGRIGRRSGALMDSVQNPKFNIVGNNGNFQAEAYVPLHMRFLDMKRIGNWKIYNRQIFGILYRNTIGSVRFGYGRDMHDTVGVELDRAFESLKK